VPTGSTQQRGLITSHAELNVSETARGVDLRKDMRSVLRTTLRSYLDAPLPRGSTEHADPRGSSARDPGVLPGGVEDAAAVLSIARTPLPPPRDQFHSPSGMGGVRDRNCVYFLQRPPN
jgi:hypothetical protein